MVATAQTENRFLMDDLSGTLRQLVVNTLGAAGSVEVDRSADSGVAQNKFATVVKLTVNGGQEVDVLVRFLISQGVIFLDLVADQSVAALSTTVAAMDLSSLGTGHPSPKKDVIDAQAMVGAGGT